jgi:phosphinothricin acetyltransferase
MEIRDMLLTDWQEVKLIYESGMISGNATFETTAPSWESWDNAHLNFGRIIAIENQQIVAWAALSGVSGRCVYAGVAEVSIYIHEQYRGKGIGKILLNKLVETSEKNGIWTLQAGIFPENEASLAIHQKAGFRIIGYREKIGKQHGKWRNTVLLERRSTIIGIE